MSISNLMFQTVNLWRQINRQGTASQDVAGYELIAENVAANIQPMDSQTAWYYSQRGIENSHTVYFSDTSLTVKRNDIIQYQDEQYHVNGFKNGLKLNIYQEILVDEYPENGKKKLNIEAYE